MDKCKFCQAELAEENAAVCPQCGKNQEEVLPEETAAQEQKEELTAAEEAPKEETTEETSKEETSEEETTEEETSEEETSEEKDAEKAEPEQKKATPGKIAAAVVAVVVLVAILVSLIMSGMRGGNAPAVESTPAQQEAVMGTVPPDGNPEDVTCKGTYTLSDEEVLANKDTVVAVIGDQELTNGQLQVYYWSMVNSYLSSEYGYYLMMYGILDYTQPFDTQISFEDNTLTWQQYFLKEALNYWQLSVGLAGEAEKAGFQISQADQEYLDNLPTSLDATAASYGMTRDALLYNNIGPGAGIEEFMAFQQMYCAGKDFYQDRLAQMKPTQEELEAFFAEHEAGYAESGITKDATYVDVRHILIKVEGGTAAADGTVTYTDAEWETCYQEAQAVLNRWLAGDKTEEGFAALANEVSEDPGSNTNGGLYENVYVGQMVAPFEEWCFDASRQYGDYGLVKTSYGYHVMFYVGSEPMWISYAESDWVQEQSNQFVEGMTVNYPMEVYYDKISLGYINLGA